MPQEPAPPKTVAAVTMVYNEPDFLPIWLAYYGRQVGPENCYVIDHGSDDGSVDAIGAATRMRVPRTAFDVDQKALFVSNFCASLLQWFDCVIYTDVDEILVADPRYHPSLRGFCGAVRHDVVTAFGVNVIHRLHHEVAIDPTQPIMAQRRFSVASASMCKPLLARVPVQWGPGFHSCDAPMAFDRLLLFHLAYYDLRTALRRQAKRRATPRKPEIANHHHKLKDDKIYGLMEGWSKLPTVESADMDLDVACPVRAASTNRVLQSRTGREARGIKIDTGIWSDRLWRLPARFQNAF